MTLPNSSPCFLFYEKRPLHKGTFEEGFYGGIIRGRVSPLHDEALLFRQKDPKPCSPVRVPTGELRHLTESKWFRNSLRSNSLRQRVGFGKAAPPRPRRKETQETNQEYKLRANPTKTGSSEEFVGTSQVTPK